MVGFSGLPASGLGVGDGDGVGVIASPSSSPGVGDGESGRWGFDATLYAHTPLLFTPTLARYLLSLLS